MPMGTVGHLTNGTTTTTTTTTTSLSNQPHSSYSAYTNGDYGQRWTSHPDDRISSHGARADMSESRPVSQGGGSAGSGGQSRPPTSQAMISTSSAPLVTPILSRPESSGTDLAPQPHMRHGFAEAYSSEEYLNMLEQVSTTLPVV
jgi:hypothetical protein